MTATTSQNHRDAQGQILLEAGRRMLPVLAARLGAAAADRAEEGIERLADRLDDLAEHGLGGRDAADPEDGDPEDGDTEGSGSKGLVATVIEQVITQARALLDLIVGLLAQAAAFAREAAGRLRARRAPEGIDEEDGDLEDLDLTDGEFEVVDVEDDDEDEDLDRPA